MYQFDSDTAESCLREVMGSTLRPEDHPQEVRVVLYVPEGYTRGHYSRLFQESDWELHLKRFGGDDENPIYSSGSDTTSSDGDGDESDDDGDDVFFLFKHCSSDLGDGPWNLRPC